MQRSPADGRVVVGPRERMRRRLEARLRSRYLAAEPHVSRDGPFGVAFFEQYSHEPYIAVLRFWLAVAKQPTKKEELDAKRKGGNAALDALEGRLAVGPTSAAIPRYHRIALDSASERPSSSTNVGTRSAGLRPARSCGRFERSITSTSCRP